MKKFGITLGQETFNVTLTYEIPAIYENFLTQGIMKEIELNEMSIGVSVFEFMRLWNQKWGHYITLTQE